MEVGGTAVRVAGAGVGVASLLHAARISARASPSNAAMNTRLLNISSFHSPGYATTNREIILAASMRLRLAAWENSLRGAHLLLVDYGQEGAGSRVSGGCCTDRVSADGHISTSRVRAAAAATLVFWANSPTGLT